MGKKVSYPKSRTIKPRKKRILVIRMGGIGDVIYSTPLYRLYAQHNNLEVHAYVRINSLPILENNPWLKKVYSHEGMFDEKDPKFPERWEWQMAKWEKYFDYVSDLSFAVEKRFMIRTDLKFGPIPSIEDRRKNAESHNYYNATLEKGRFMKIKGLLPEIYLSRSEKDKIDNRSKEFRIVWHFDGSTLNKHIVYGGDWVRYCLSKHPDVRHTILGSHRYGFVNDKRVKFLCDSIPLRETIVQIASADLVVGTESAIINLSGAFEVPKIILYSHSTHENLGKYFANVHPIYPGCKCSPCYLIPIHHTGCGAYEDRRAALEWYKHCVLWNRYNMYEPFCYKCVATIPQAKVLGKISEIISGSSMNGGGKK